MTTLVLLSHKVCQYTIISSSRQKPPSKDRKIKLMFTIGYHVNNAYVLDVKLVLFMDYQKLFYTVSHLPLSTLVKSATSSGIYPI